MTEHAYERCDADPSGDEDQVSFLRVQCVREATEGTTDEGHIFCRRVGQGSREVARGLDRERQDIRLRWAR